MKTLAFILSVIATVGACIPPLLKGKNMKLILLVVCTNNALLATSYVLTGAFNGAASCYLGAVQTFINYFFERKGQHSQYCKNICDLRENQQIHNHERS